MFLKIVGSILIVSACTGYGLEKGREYKKHVKQLEELIRITDLFAMETSYSKLPISELSTRIMNRVDDPYHQWLFYLSRSLNGDSDRRLAEIWEQEAEKLLSHLLLDVEEGEELKKLGLQLGNYNIEMQEQVFRRYSQYLEMQRNRYSAVMEEKQKICSTLGILFGIFLVIIFF